MVIITTIVTNGVMFCRILKGNGQVVDGDKGVVYTHKDLPIES